MNKTIKSIILVFLPTIAWTATHHPQVFLKSIAGLKNEGAHIVQHYCAMCHAKEPQIQLGAPRIGCLDDWQPRLKQGSTMILKHTYEGLNAMPARGGCFECTDAQLLLAIQALLPSQVKKDFK